MGKFLIPTLLLALSIGSYFLYTKPIYEEAKVISEEVVKLKDAQTKLNDALKKRDNLATSYNSLDTALVARLEKLMPDNLDNIKLIIDIDRTAKQYGMILNSVKFDVDQSAKAGSSTTTASTTVAIRDNKTALENKKDYNSFNLTMTFSGNFSNFTKLMSDIEKNLRIIDVSSITFDAQDGKDIYKYEVKAKIYWLKSLNQ